MTAPAMRGNFIIDLIFVFGRTAAGRVFVGFVLAGAMLYFGLKGLITGEVWVPSSSAFDREAMKFGGWSGECVSMAYLSLGMFLHYVGFWRRGRLEEIRRDPVALLFLVLCFVSTIGFVIAVVGGWFSLLLVGELLLGAAIVCFIAWRREKALRARTFILPPARGP